MVMRKSTPRADFKECRYNQLLAIPVRLLGYRNSIVFPYCEISTPKCGIPREVEKEFLAVDETDYQEVLNSTPWIKVVDLTNPQRVSIYQGLDDGEAEVFALAAEHDARLILLDEKKGRRKAKEIGLPVKGIVGVLLEAKEKALIDVIKPFLIQLRDNGIHLSDRLINNALQDAGEAD